MAATQRGRETQRGLAATQRGFDTQRGLDTLRQTESLRLGEHFLGRERRQAETRLATEIFLGEAFFETERRAAEMRFTRDRRTEAFLETAFLETAFFTGDFLAGDFLADAFFFEALFLATTLRLRLRRRDLRTERRPRLHERLADLRAHERRGERQTRLEHERGFEHERTAEHERFRLQGREQGCWMVNAGPAKKVAAAEAAWAAAAVAALLLIFTLQEPIAAEVITVSLRATLKEKIDEIESVVRKILENKSRE